MPIPALATPDATPDAQRLRRVRAFRLAAAALVAVHAVLAWLIRKPGVLTVQDDAYYLLLARALRQLRYVDLWRVDEPLHLLYPPGYPALLALWGALVGEHHDALILPGIAASVATLALLYLLLERRWSPEVGLIALAALFLNPDLVDLAGTLRPEAIYGLASTAALALTLRSPQTPATLAAIGAAAVGGAMLRAPGLTLLVVIGLHWLMERRFKAFALLFGISLATVGLWLFWVFTFPADAADLSYAVDLRGGDAGGGSQVARRLVRVGRSLFSYLATSVPFRLAVPTVHGTLIDNAVGAALTTLLIAGGLVALWRRWKTASLYIIVYSALLIWWPWQRGRFLAPLLPFLGVAAVVGADAIARRLRPGLALPAMLVVAVILGGNGAILMARTVRLASACERGTAPPAPSCVSPDQASFFAATGYVNRMLPHDAVLLTAKPEPVYVYSGRQSVGWSKTMRDVRRPGAEFTKVLRQAGVTHILLASLRSSEVALLGVLEANCSGVRRVASFEPRTHLFRVLDEPSPPDSAATCETLAGYRQAIKGRDYATEQWPPGSAGIGVQPGN